MPMRWAHVQVQLQPAFAASEREPDMTVIVFLDELNTAPLECKLRRFRRHPL